MNENLAYSLSSADTLQELVAAIKLLIGQPGQQIITVIERSSILKYAEALGDMNPLYFHEPSTDQFFQAGLIPPTYFSTLPYQWPELLTKYRDRARLINIANTFLFQHSPAIGDSISTQATIVDVRRHNQLLLVELRCAYIDKRNTEVATGTITWVVLGADLTIGDLVDIGNKTLNAHLSPSTRAGIDTPPYTFKAWPRPDPSVLQEGSMLPCLSKPPITTMQLVKFAAASADFSPIHYDKDFAQSVGLPDIIVPGLLKLGFLAQHIITWMGPYGMLQELSARYQGIDFPGDALTSLACVTRLTSLAAHGYQVELALRLRNQRGEENTMGEALVLFPAAEACQT